jgi:hypothetical protein
VLRLAQVQREMTAERRKAARRDGELLRGIREAKRDGGQAGSHTAVPKEERSHELSVLVATDEERMTIEAEIARLTIKRERIAGALETHRNEMRFIQLEIRAELRGAGEPDYQPDRL